MKILFLCTYYHRAMVFRDLMDKLIDLGHSIKVFNAVVKNAIVDDKYRNIMDEAVIHRECFTKWDRFFYFRKQNKFYNSLINSCDVNEYDILHSHTLFNGGYVAYKVKKQFGIPYIVSVRNTDINTFLRIPLFANIANKIINESVGVQFLSSPYKDVFINKHIKESLKSSVHKKSVIIRNGLEPYWLNNKAKAKMLNDSKLINILCVGKIDKNKNLISTIRAIEILISQGYDVKFTVVGQVVDKGILSYLKESRFTQVIDYLPKEELLKIYRKNDIYVMPSIHETFGRVYAEAMTQGLPVIYSRGQGFDGIFEDGCVGYATPSKNPGYIVECIVKIIRDYSNISLRCVRYCDEFNWSKITEQTDKFYQESLMRARSDIS